MNLFKSLIMVYIFYVLECKGWILLGFFFLWALELDVSLGVYWFLIDICDDSTIYIFMRISKKVIFFKVFYIGHYILGCRLLSRWYNSLMSLNGHFKNMK